MFLTAGLLSSVAKSYLTLCDPVDCSLPGSSVHGIFQARIWSGLPFPSPGDLPDPGIKPVSPASAGRFFNTEPFGGPNCSVTCYSVLPESRLSFFRDSQVVLVIKNPPANAGDLRDTGSILGSGRSPGGGHGNPLQYCCLENPMDRGDWWATVHGVTQSRIWLKWLSMHTDLVLETL